MLPRVNRHLAGSPRCAAPQWPITLWRITRLFHGASSLNDQVSRLTGAEQERVRSGAQKPQGRHTAAHRRRTADGRQRIAIAQQAHTGVSGLTAGANTEAYFLPPGAQTRKQMDRPAVALNISVPAWRQLLTRIVQAAFFFGPCKSGLPSLLPSYVLTHRLSQCTSTPKTCDGFSCPAQPTSHAHPHQTSTPPSKVDFATQRVKNMGLRDGVGMSSSDRLKTTGRESGRLFSLHARACRD